MDFSDELGNLDSEIETIDAKIASLKEERKQLVSRRTHLLSMIDEKSDSIDLTTSAFECEADEIIDISHDLEPNSASASASATVPNYSSRKSSDILQWKRTGKLYLVIVF